MDKARRVEELVGELEKIITELEEIAPPTYQAGELVLEDNKIPGGRYLTIAKTTDGYITIDSGEYGRWHTTIKLRREHQEY